MRTTQLKFYWFIAGDFAHMAMEQTFRLAHTGSRGARFAIVGMATGNGLASAYRIRSNESTKFSGVGMPAWDSWETLRMFPILCFFR